MQLRVEIDRTQNRQVESHSGGQVAQSVERSPEKAGVGGSIPSLATMFLKDLLAFPYIRHLPRGVHLESKTRKKTCDIHAAE